MDEMLKIELGADDAAVIKRWFEEVELSGALFGDFRRSVAMGAMVGAIKTAAKTELSEDVDVDAEMDEYRDWLASLDAENDRDLSGMAIELPLAIETPGMARKIRDALFDASEARRKTFAAGEKDNRIAKALDSAGWQIASRLFLLDHPEYDYDEMRLCPACVVGAMGECARVLERLR